MIRILLQSALIWSITICAALADDVADNFDDNTLDTNLWQTPVILDHGLAWDEINQRFEITFEADAHNSSGGQDVFDVKLFSAIHVAGDFDIQVDFDHIQWPFANGVRTALSVRTPDGSSVAWIERASRGTQQDNPGQPREVYYSHGQLVQTNDISGGMRIVRTGNQVTTFWYDTNQSAWSPLGTAPFSTEPIVIGLSAWSHDYAFTNNRVVATFDNLQVFADSCGVFSEDFEVLHGFHIGGDLVDTNISDDLHMTFWPLVPFFITQPHLELLFTSTLPIDDPLSLTFTLETGINTIGVEQTIELFNYDVGAFEQVDVRPTTFADSEAVIVLGGDITRFVEAGTGNVKARLSWDETGHPFLYPWTLRIDRLSWSTVPQ